MKRKRAKQRAKLPGNEKLAAPSTTKKVTYTLAELVIVNPLANIHGEPIMPKEEIIELEDIELPKFQVDLEAKR